MKPLHIYIIAAIIAFGALVEVFKSFHIASPTTARMGFSLSNTDWTPYALSAETLKTQKKLVEKLIKNQRGFRLSGGPAVTQQPAAEVADTDTSAEAKNKKKKAKKSRTAKKEDLLTDPTKIYAEQDTRNKVNFSKSEDSTFFIAAPAAENKDAKKTKTYEEWAEMILGSPQPESMQKLIDAFRNGEVSADIFYAILNALMSEKNAEQHELAVYAASSIQTPHSFLFLVDVIKSLTSADSARTMANNHINEYKSTDSVGQLTRVFNMAAEDFTAVFLATRVLNSSTQSYLENKAAVVNPNDPGTPTNTHLVSSMSERRRYTSIYNEFVAILEKILVDYASNAEISQNASEALGRIRNYTSQNVVVAGND